MIGLYSLCWLGNVVHWLKIAVDGRIIESSVCGFADESEALIDLRYRL